MNEPLADRVYEVAAELFALLATPTRLRIVCSLMHGERTVGQLVEQLGIGQPNISQHLNTLYRGGVLARRREGAHMHYRIHHSQVREWCVSLLGGSSADCKPMP